MGFNSGFKGLKKSSPSQNCKV